jgi:uncharacterized membrane protein YfcA
MIEFSPLQYVVGAVSAWLIGLAKAGVPGASMVTIPLMADQFGAKVSVGLILPTLITGDICALLYYRRFAKWALIIRVLPLTIAGIVIGWFLLGTISDIMLKRSIGALILALLGLRYGLARFDMSGIERAGAFGAPVGVLAGITTTLANAAGPLIIVYLLWAKIKKEEFIGTAAWFFFIVNCCKVPFFVHREMITAATLPYNAMAIPLVIAGAASGIWVLKKMNQHVFEVLVQLLAVAASLKLLLAGWI